MPGNPYLLAPEVNANPLLSDSWSRCQRYGLDPATEDFPRLGAGELADRLASHRGLGDRVIAAVPECLQGQPQRVVARCLSERGMELAIVVVAPDIADRAADHFAERLGEGRQVPLRGVAGGERMHQAGDEIGKAHV